MRTIEFRAKDLDSGTSARDSEWVYGPLTAAGRYYEINGHAIDTETLGQFTGRKDINGAKIFEGDVVEYEIPTFYRNQIRKERAVIQWSDGDAGFVAGSYVFWKLVEQQRAVVVGNIFDDSRLLGVNRQ